MSAKTSSEPTRAPGKTGPLAGLKVIDAATLFAGPVVGMLLGDFGADVTKVEHPQGDPARVHGPAKKGASLWWKVIARNKQAISLYLGAPEGQAIFRRLAREADVIIENFRPGTLERWGLGYETLAADNPGLVLLRVTAFGQHGPYSDRPGFGTIAEAMSGFAALTGEPDGPPTLPPFGLADGITGISAAFAVMAAIHARTRTGRGQVIDIALIEPILTVLGPQPIIYDQIGTIQRRTGNRSVKNAPRNTYRTSDGKWVAISTSSRSVADRVMQLVGWPEVTQEPWFATGLGRVSHGDELDAKVSSWIAKRTQAEVLTAFAEADAAAAAIYDISDIFRDPQYAALDSITTVEDEDLGPLRMQNVLFRMSDTPGSIRSTGRAIGADNDEVYKRQLGMSDAELAQLKAKGVI